MLHPENIEQKLAFDTIRKLLAEACLSSLGRNFVEKMRFSDDYTLINRLLHQTNEFKQILQFEDGFPNAGYLDVTPQLRKAEILNTWLDASEWRDIKVSLTTILQCLAFFNRKEEDKYLYLKELAQPIQIDKQVINAIDVVLDENSRIRDNASPELSTVRRDLLAEQQNLRKTLDRLLKQAKHDGLIDDDISLTIRSGRMVIPLAAEHKRKIKGFIHDESASGQTVFMEPAEAFDANNRIRELEFAEQREIIKILTLLTDKLRPYVPALRKGYVFLGLMDFIRAKAKFAFQIEGTLPFFSKTSVIKWRQARHPLLYLSLRKQGKAITPLTIDLDTDQRILVISGPNAGGKSICLKTVGLVQYMLQCGLLPPMQDYSEIGVFNSILIDIGDEQSLENDLSTYSSHLKAMKQFITLAGKRTLFLIDEFGAGTDPQFGGAIAESILEAINQQKAIGVVTTHYSNLKSFAEKAEGIVNGAMRYDVQHLEPLYQLEIGNPGSSFALEIAQKIGLPQGVINQAKGKLGEKQVNFDKLLLELEAEKELLHKELQEVQMKERGLTQELTRYKQLSDEVAEKRKVFMNEAKAEAKRLLQDVNKKIETTIREIRESGADKELTKLLREDLEIFKQNIAADETSKPDEYLPAEGDINIGSYVRIKDSGALGEVLLIKGNNAEIRIGDLKSLVKLNRLEKITRKIYKTETAEDANKPVMRGMDINNKMMNFSTNLDLRGLRGEEALSEVDNFIDKGIMLGMAELRIVHGKGDGILRNLIRNHLRRYKQISGMNDEHPDRGGAGVTVVMLR